MPPDHNIAALKVYGPYVCVAYFGEGSWDSNDYAGLRVIDVSNPANPVPAGQCTLGAGHTTGMAIAGNRAFLTHNRSLVVADLSNPLQPSVMGRYDFPGVPNALDAWPMDVSVAGGHAFVATSNWWPLVGPFLPGEAGLEVFDISDRATLKPVGRSLWPWGAVGVKVMDGLAFAVPSDGDLWPGMMHDGTEIRVFDVRQPAHPVQVDRGNFRMNYSGFALAGDFLFVPGEGVYRIEKISATTPALEMISGHRNTAPELWVECPGYDDFTLTTSTNLTDWQPYATVFSRLPKFKIVPDGKEPAHEPRRFYQMSGAAMSLEEMSLQWEAVRPSYYLCGFERTGPEISGVLTGSMMVYAGRPPSIHYAKLNGVPIADPNPNLFKTVDALFSMLKTSQTSADLMIIKRDPVLHYPAWIYIDPNADSAGDEVTFRINNLVDDIVIVVAPPGGGLGCKCLEP